MLFSTLCTTQPRQNLHLTRAGLKGLQKIEVTYPTPFLMELVRHHSGNRVGGMGHGLSSVGGVCCCTAESLSSVAHNTVELDSEICRLSNIAEISACSSPKMGCTALKQRLICCVFQQGLIVPTSAVFKTNSEHSLWVQRGTRDQTML